MCKGSYTSNTRSPRRWVRERYAQYTHARTILSNLEEHVAASIDEERQNVERVESRFGITLRGLRVPEVGHGQLPWRLAYLTSLGNSATGIDLDYVSQVLSPGSYYRLWRTNGLGRAVKTLGKEVLGFRRAFEREFCRQLDLHEFPDIELIQMDAAAMAFPDQTFDFVCSWDVFEHLPDPELAAEEIARVLTPGGAAVLSFVHYAWYNALHDLRLIVRPIGSFPLWAHLRDSFRERVPQGAYVNDPRVTDGRLCFKSLARMSC
jgi:SAM-dependent methyltransferase